MHGRGFQHIIRRVIVEQGASSHSGSGGRSGRHGFGETAACQCPFGNRPTRYGRSLPMPCPCRCSEPTPVDGRGWIGDWACLSCAKKKRAHRQHRQHHHHHHHHLPMPWNSPHRAFTAHNQAAIKSHTHTSRTRNRQRKHEAAGVQQLQFAQVPVLHAVGKAKVLSFPENTNLTSAYRFR